jgi:biopolymer transport protein ExbD
MKIRSRSSGSFVGFNMTPMIDVVFLLIIFFLVSSHLARRENRIPVELPVATSGQKDLTSPTPRVTLTIKSDGSVLWSGQPFGVEQLAQRLAAQRKQMGDEMELRIRGDRRVPYRVVEPILDGAARAGVWNVTFAVVDRERRL